MTAADGATGSLHPGTQKIEVTRPDGTRDPMWIHVEVPQQGTGPSPVVIYAHGQGAGNFINCEPNTPPSDSDAETGKVIARAMAARGYIGISVFYRNRGEGVPGFGELRARDSYVFDARSILGAAQWARARGASNKVALVGISMGSFAVTWATAPLPELADVQAGLDIRTMMPGAMLGNHIANAARSAPRLSDPDVAVRAQTILLVGYSSLAFRATALGKANITARDLVPPITDGLTPRGVTMVRKLLIDAADPALTGCQKLPGIAPACGGACMISAFTEIGKAEGLTELKASDWLTAETIQAASYWAPPTAIDPGEGTSVLLTAMRKPSPAYTLVGPLKTKRILPLLSSGDAVITSQTIGGSQGAVLYLEKLKEAGAYLPSPVPIINDNTCGHGDYVDEARPQCGFALVVSELAAAFAQN